MTPLLNSRLVKQLFTLSALLFLFTASIAKPVDPATAQLVGGNFLMTRAHAAHFKAGVTLDLLQTVGGKSSASQPGNDLNYYYVFNVANGDGFVLVSADDRAQAILGYSTESDFNAENIPVNTRKWLESYKSEIRYLIQNQVNATQAITTDWQQLVDGSGPGMFGKKAAVSPLVQTKWNQSPYFNALCPYDNSEGERTVTGCVATAMAQVMKFWNYPATGTGSHSYNHQSFGTLSANFGGTTYNWSSMPNTVNSANSAVATLMYHCGVSVEMGYGVASTGGSSAYVISSASAGTYCAEYALKTHFGYSSSLSGVQRNDYSDNQWMTLVKGELDNGRPILYAGFGSGGGHAFVCDGYDNNSFLHFNWGWGGAYDGYFSVNALNPGGVGTGGGTGGFNNNHQAVIGIEPPAAAPTSDMRLYSSIVVDPDPIVYGSGFTVSASFANYGTSSSANFSGDFAAAIFNANSEFVDYVETKTGYTLNYNSYYTTPIEFTTSSMSALVPGTYTVGLYYRPTGTQQWVAFANGSYQNFVTVTVKGNDTNPLKLYAPITVTPSTITRNQTFTVTFDIANFASSQFDGEVSVDIHKSDGTWIRELAKQSNISLPSNTHFTNGLTFTITGGIDDSAGTYQFFVWDKPTSGNWEFLGNGSYSNPVNVEVKEPGLTPDIYEANNTQATAFNIPLSFSGNTGTKTTAGSNIHVGNDYDYYKVNLPAGYNYLVSGRVHDSYSKGNSQTYTVDALVSYSTDGTNWSEAFDDVLPNNITMNGGGTLYFMVSPYFTGSIGTYLLDFTITRSPMLSAEKEITAFTATGVVGTASINSGSATVSMTVSGATDITSLSPVISISPFANISPASGVARDFTAPVTYTVTAQDATTKQWTVTVSKATGIAESGATGLFSVYPNPASDMLHVGTVGKNNEHFTVKLFDAQGRKVLEQACDGETALSLAGFETGFYAVMIESARGTAQSKIVIKK
jgi:hypothetical protein